MRRLTLPFSTPIRLRLPDSSAEFADAKTTDIYWGELWPSAIALADAFLAGEIRTPPGAAPVLEIGCGSGLIAIAAALAGDASTRVVATDRDPRALALTEENASRNGVAERISTRTLDWCAPSAERYGLILAGDCLYQPDAGAQIVTFLRTALADGGRAIVVDPERWTARHFGLLAREAGFGLRVWRRAVPFVTEHGPVRHVSCEKCAQPVDVVCYELTC